MARVNVEQRFVPNDHAVRSHLSMIQKYITIHETANKSCGANAEMHAQYMLSQAAIDREVLWHYTVDCHRIIQHLPTNEVGWHASDGYDGVGNRQSIAVEMCVNEDGDFEATQRLAAKLVADLVESTPSLLVFPDCLVQHNHWSGKNCPTTIRSTTNGWERFTAMANDELRPATTFNDVPCDAWYADDVRFLHDAGIVNGDPNGNFRPNDALTRAEAARLLRLVVRYTTGK